MTMIREIEKIRRLYNPEHDVIADNVIPWYVMELAELVERQQKEIEKLGKVVKALNDEIAYYHS